MDFENEKDKNEAKYLAKPLEAVFQNEEDVFKSTMDESLENTVENPLLLSPVIRCFLKFLNIEEMKNCRHVCREWGSIGKLALGNRATISFDLGKCLHRRPVNFYSRFLDSVSFFGAFKIYGYITKRSSSCLWTIEELTKFFDEQQKYIKELTLGFARSDVEHIDLSSWIAKSPMVQKDTKFMTKLSIGSIGKIDIPLGLIVYIKDLSLRNCRISLEAGIKICPVKLCLLKVTFVQDGINLHRLRINDIMDFGKAKEVWLDRWDFTKCVLDLRGRVTLDKMRLEGCEIVNGKISQWTIEDMSMNEVPYSLNSQMKIQKLLLTKAGDIDLFTLPNSIQHLNLHFGNTATCSQPILLQNLQFLNAYTANDFSFLSHFMNCPQLIQLSLYGQPQMQMNSLWMPKSVKKLWIHPSFINWDDANSYFNFEQLVFEIIGSFSIADARKLCKTKIRVDDVFLDYYYLTVADFVEFLENQRRFNFGKRLFIGQLKWDEKPFNDSLLKEYVDEKSSYYVFENGGKGRAISDKAISLF